MATLEAGNGPHFGLPVLRAGTPLDQAQVAMILVHGRGASPEDILALGQELASSVDVPLAMLAPTAADSSWYPHSFLVDMERNQPGLSSALATIGDTLGIVTASGVPPERTILLGFSQGACLALEFAARNARRYGGVVGLSGGLIGPPGTPREYQGALAATPVFLGCDELDPHIPKERVEESAAVMEKLGGEVTKRIYRGLGHSVNREELDWVRELVRVTEPT